MQLAVFIVGLHLLAFLFVLFFFSVPLLPKLLLIVVIIFSGLYYYRLFITKQMSGSIEQVSLNVDNQWKLVMVKDQRIYSAVLLPTSMFSRYLIILNFKAGSGQSYTLILPNDSIDRELARQIRARVKVLRL